MPKFVVLAPYREPSGYGEASRRYIQALIEAGADIACRPVILSEKDLPIPDFISTAEQNRIERPDAVLQISPPYIFEKVPEPTFGLFFTETNPLPNFWALYCSSMDGIIQPSKAQTVWSRNNINYKVDDSVVNIPARPYSHYKKEYKRPSWMGLDTFKFYTIGEDTERKNLRGIIRAYFSAFKANDPVELIIKTNKNIDVLEISNGCNLANFPAVRVISAYMTEDEICSLHQHANCFVQASYSEGYSLPCFDALFFGKTPIAPNSGGYKEFLNNENSYLVDCQEEYCYNGGKVHSELFTCKQTWFSPSLKALSDKMVLAYSNIELRNSMRSRAFDNYDGFTPIAIGKQLIGVLNGKTEERRP